MQPPGEGELARLRQELAGGGSTQALLGSASELLSAMSHFVGVVSAPRREQFAFRQIDFVALDGRRVLAILVFADNRYRTGSLRPAGSLRRGSWSRSPTTSMRISPACRWPRSAPPAAGTARCPVRTGTAAGAQHRTGRTGPAAAGRRHAGGRPDQLMGVQDLSDLERLRELFELFSSKREILQLLGGPSRRRACASSSARRPG